jgi:hypothetical protein
MGLIYVLMIWAVILASIAAALFGGAAALFTRGIKEGRRRTIVIACLFPFICLGWCACVFLFQAVVNEGFLGRDMVLGTDNWHCPLPNGYMILMFDVKDHGLVYKLNSGLNSVGERGDSEAFHHMGQDNHSVDRYFLLDTRTRKPVTFDSLEALRARAGELSIRLDLQPISRVYWKYRFTWFDILVGLLFCMAPIGGTVLLVLQIKRLRRSHRLSLQLQGG